MRRTILRCFSQGDYNDAGKHLGRSCMGELGNYNAKGKHLEKPQQHR